jgi:hypothetical protein
VTRVEAIEAHLNIVPAPTPAVQPVKSAVVVNK